FKGHGLGRKSPARQFKDNAGIFSTGKQQSYFVELASYLTQDVDGFIFQVLQVRRESRSHRDLKSFVFSYSCNPHSVLPSAKTRPARASSPSPTGKVTGAQPIER